MNSEMVKIRKHDSCKNQNMDEEVKMNIDSSNYSTKIVTYKLFNENLVNIVVKKMRENENLLFCGFKVVTDFNIEFDNDHFNYDFEYNRLRNFNNVLVSSANNRFWFIYAMNIDKKSDYINIEIPMNKGYIPPKIYLKFCQFNSYTTGCFFKKVNYELIEL